MSSVTVIWSMVIAACLTLAAVHLPVWWSNRADRAGLAFSLATISTAAFAICELWMFHAQTPRAYAEVLRWAHVPIALWVITTAAFVYFYLDAGRPWLAFGAIGLRLVALPFNFIAAQNLNYREVTALRSISILGEPVSVAVGVPNPWMAVGQLGLLLLIVFVADASDHGLAARRAYLCPPRRRKHHVLPDRGRAQACRCSGAWSKRRSWSACSTSA